MDDYSRRGILKVFGSGVVGLASLGGVLEPEAGDIEFSDAETCDTEGFESENYSLDQNEPYPYSRSVSSYRSEEICPDYEVGP